jgi:hypothetical protein
MRASSFSPSESVVEGFVEVDGVEVFGRIELRQFSQDCVEVSLLGRIG